MHNWNMARRSHRETIGALTGMHIDGWTTTVPIKVTELKTERSERDAARVQG